MNTQQQVSFSFFLPAFKTHDFEKLINIVNRKSDSRHFERLGVDRQDATRTVSVCVNREDHIYANVLVNGQDVTITGYLPMIDGWQTIGVCQYMADGEVFAKALQGREIPEKYHQRQACSCDHCGTNRSRKFSYILQHNDGRTMLVGSNCSVDFFGMADAFFALESFRQLEALGEGDYEYDNCVKYILFNHSDITLTALRMVDAYGFKPSSFGAESTRADVMEYLNSRPVRQEFDRQFPLTEGQKSRFDSMMDWARNLEEKGDYMINLKKIACSETVDHRNIGLAVSMVSAWERAIGTEKLRQAERAKEIDAYYGQVKERIKNMTATVIDVRTYEKYATYSYYESPIGYIYKLRNDDGYLFCWMTGENRDISKGDRIQFTGTVKSHEEYKGRKQTLLKNCKVEVLEPEPASCA